MFLEKIGGRGLDLALIKKIISLLHSSKVTVGGGLKTEGQFTTSQNRRRVCFLPLSYIEKYLGT